MPETFDYLEARDDADGLITEFGTTVSIRRVTNSGTEWEPTQTPADHATVGARIEFSARQMASGNVLATDERWLVAAGGLAVVPTAGDSFVIGASLRGSIVDVKPLSPAGVDVMYDCQVRV